MQVSRSLGEHAWVHATIVLMVAPLLALGQDVILGQDVLLGQELPAQHDSTNLAPCSCDCCQVAHRDPQEVVMLTNNISLEYKCTRPNIPNLEGEYGSACPGRCQMGNSALIIRTANGNTELDYSRFCRYKCKPSSISVGSQCIRLNFTETKLSSEPTENGAGDVPFLAAASNNKSSWEKDILESTAQQKRKLEAEAELKTLQGRSIAWDLRKLIAHRYRAEAGADMTRALADGEFVRTYQNKVEQASLLARRVSDAIFPADAEIDGSIIQTEQNFTAAEASSVAAEKSLSEVEATTNTYIGDAERLAKEAIEKSPDVQKLAEEEAQVDAKRFGWDKPDFWPKIMAVKAADPYMNQMVVAIQRASEYDSYAKSLLSQARGAQGKAATLNAQANAMAMGGDRMGAATEWDQVKALIGRSKKLDSEAQKFWKVASDVQQSIPEWQGAGMSAATYAAWSYSATFTPPPDFS